MRKTTTTKNCGICNQKMIMPFWLSKTKKFCSKKCSGQNLMEKSQKIISCLVCKKEIKIPKSMKKLYCSYKCYWKTIDGTKLSSLSKGTLGWKKDITLIAKSEKKHLDTRYKQWMLEVKKRDNWKCKISNADCKGRLESHHILNWIDYPELRYDINNGITLCRSHHPLKWEEEKRLSPYFMDLVSVSKI